MDCGIGTPGSYSLIAANLIGLRLSVAIITHLRKAIATIVFVTFIVFPLHSSAQDTASAAVDSIPADSVASFYEIIFFKCNKTYFSPELFDNEQRLANIRDFLVNNDTIPGIKYRIFGTASPEGPKNNNVQLSRNRAGRLASLLHDYTSHPIDTTSRPTLIGSREQWPRLRYATFYAEWPVPRPHIRPIHIEIEPPTLNLGIIPIDTTLIPIKIPVVRKHRIWIPPLFISNNFLQDVALVPNIGLGFSVYRQLTFFIDYYHAWWFNRHDRYCWRWYGGDVELRWQLGHGKTDNRFAGWWVGTYFSTYTYDFQFGREKKGVQGNKYNHAAGLSFGYSLPIARRFHLNFLLGVGYQWGRYYQFHTVDDEWDHDVWLQTRHRRFFGPTRAEVGISWLIGTDNVNIFKPRAKAKEGGRR